MTGIIDINTQFGPMPSAATDLAVDDLSNLMGAHGVTMCCTLSTLGVLLDYHMGNAATRAACKENASLLPAATVNPTMYFGTETPVGHFGADGFRLVRFFPEVQGWPPVLSPFVNVVNVLEAEGLPIMVDVTRPGMASELVRMVGENGTSIVLAGVDESNLAEAVCLMRTHEHVFLETSRLMAVGALKLVVDHVGADRVLFGSGAPARPIASALNVLRHAGLTDEQVARVMSGNARALLRL